MEWEKSPPELVELFNATLPDDPAVQRRQMFGYPGAFVNGNMFAGTHKSQLIVRLAKDDYDELLAIPGAGPFEPMPGRRMGGYAAVPESMLGDDRLLRSWLQRAFTNASAMPAKQRKSPVKRRR
jgi:TfoX/Sxy family transcriptional regulator of competence genes